MNRPTLLILCLIGLYQSRLSSSSSLPWRTASYCTTNSAATLNTHNPQQQQQSQPGLSVVSNQLELNCDSEHNGGLLYIAWSHYGYRLSSSSSLSRQSVNSNSNCSFDSGSIGDCMVSVDYVANECNGLSKCQISLDSQYLHSCKAYSHYLFIVYQCVPNERIFDICQQESGQQTTQSSYQITDTFYLR